MPRSLLALAARASGTAASTRRGQSEAVNGSAALRMTSASVGNRAALPGLLRDSQSITYATFRD